MTDPAVETSMPPPAGDSEAVAEALGERIDDRANQSRLLGRARPRRLEP